MASFASVPVIPVPGRAGWSATRREADDARRLEEDLREALRSRRFHLQYQPRVTLPEEATVGAEALLRWQHPKRGPISPAVFIPIAETVGLIGELGAWSLAAACAEASRWPEDVTISVNVSAAQLAGGALLDQVAAALASSGLAPHRLELELTESMLVDAGAGTLLLLSSLRDRGIGIALDDFGTGYAGLATMKRLPLTAMKLDRLLVRGLPDEPEDAAIARAVVETGHALGLKVVAEGVATRAAAAYLADLGCDQAQAFLFGRPTSAAEIRARLARRP